MKRRRRYHVQYFPDGPDGPFESLRAAIAWRDERWLELGSPTHVQARNRRNTSGVTGVRLEVSRAGGESYVAKWNDADGRRHGRGFSLDRYGKKEALRLATAAREAGVAATRKDKQRRLLDALYDHRTVLAVKK